MKISVYDRKKKLLKEHHVDFDQLMLEAQSKFDGDPINGASEVIRTRLEAEGISLECNLLGSLERRLGEIAVSGDESLGIDIVGGQVIDPKKRAGSGPSSMNQSELFERVVTYPHEKLKEIYDALVGLDSMKAKLVKEAVFLTSPNALAKWSKMKHGGKIISATKTVEQRSPFLIFAGDVGTGKTALAESFGNAISEIVRKPVKLFRISIMTRGGGIVGEMTKLITAAFKAAEVEANASEGPTILLLDEADALAQSREAVQMHHEDRAGVNALIQGIDRIRMNTRTMLVIFCTNRLTAIDPAIRRRAADIFEFKRPDGEQRKLLIQQYSSELSLIPEDLDELVKLTGETGGRNYGFSYSDIVNRVFPNAIFSCYPDNALTFQALRNAVLDTKPTEPFAENK